MSLSDKFLVAGIVFVLICMHCYLYGLLRDVSDTIDDHGHYWWKQWLEMAELKRRVDDLEHNMDAKTETKSGLYDVYVSIDGTPCAVVPKALDGAPTSKWLKTVADNSDEDIVKYIRTLSKSSGGAK